jgi:hypothetical protein
LARRVDGALLACGEIALVLEQPTLEGHQHFTLPRRLVRASVWASQSEVWRKVLLARSDFFEEVEPQRICLDSRLDEGGWEFRVAHRPLCILARVVGFDDGEGGVVETSPEPV